MESYLIRYHVYVVVLWKRSILEGGTKSLLLSLGLLRFWFLWCVLGFLVIMKIISWNIRGLGSRKKRRVVKDFLFHENLDVVLLQEIKRESCDRRFVGTAWKVRNKRMGCSPSYRGFGNGSNLLGCFEV